MCAPHERAQHRCRRVLSVAYPGILTVADIKGDVGATRETLRYMLYDFAPGANEEGRAVRKELDLQ